MINSLIKNMKLSLEEIMNVLEIPKEEQAEVIEYFKDNGLEDSKID